MEALCKNKRWKDIDMIKAAINFFELTTEGNNGGIEVNEENNCAGLKCNFQN